MAGECTLCKRENEQLHLVGPKFEDHGLREGFLVLNKSRELLSVKMKCLRRACIFL